MVGPGLSRRCSIDVSIEQERRVWRLGGLSSDCCKAEFLAFRTAEGSKLLFVDGHSDGSHDLQERPSGVFEM